MPAGVVQPDPPQLTSHMASNAALMPVLAARIRGKTLFHRPHAGGGKMLAGARGIAEPSVVCDRDEPALADPPG